MDHPRANVIAVGSADDYDSMLAAINGGARGYLYWDGLRPGLVATLTHVLNQAAPTIPHIPTGIGVQLTERELQLLRGMSRDSNRQIARELCLSEETIKTRAQRLYRKLSVHDRAHTVAHGLHRGLVT